MSRSRRKKPITGITTAVSEKQDKRLANRAFRRRVNIALQSDKEPPFSMNQVSSVWAFDKDGKQYLSKSALEESPELIRK